MCTEKERFIPCDTRETFQAPLDVWVCVKIKDIDFLYKYSARHPRALNNIDNPFKIAPLSRNSNNFIPLQRDRPGENISINSCTYIVFSYFDFFVIKPEE